MPQLTQHNTSLTNLTVFHCQQVQLIALLQCHDLAWSSCSEQAARNRKQQQARHDSLPKVWMQAVSTQELAGQHYVECIRDTWKKIWFSDQKHTQNIHQGVKFCYVLPWFCKPKFNDLRTEAGIGKDEVIFLYQLIRLEAYEAKIFPLKGQDFMKKNQVYI